MIVRLGSGRGRGLGIEVGPAGWMTWGLAPTPYSEVETPAPQGWGPQGKSWGGCGGEEAQAAAGCRVQSGDPGSLALGEATWALLS